ncbi:unnamed protein product, partial [Closterium sp. NIES-54]
VDFEVWLDDLQLFLHCDSKDGLSLFDLTSGASTAPAADADITVRSQWTTRDAAARLAVRSPLPCTLQLPTAALSRLMLPYLSPDLAAFATVADLVAHLRTSDARYRTALPTAFLPTNSPPMYITHYYLVTRLPDSLSSVRDHFLSLCPTELIVDLLEERLAAAEKSSLAVGASRGDRRTPFFEGCSPVPLLPSVASAAADDLVGNEEVDTASASSGRRRTGKGLGFRVLVLELLEVLLVLELLEVLLGLVLGSPPSPGPPPPSLSPPPVPSQSQLQPASPLPGPSPYSKPTTGLTERREPESCPVSPVSRSSSPVHSVRNGRVSCPRLPPVPGTHSMKLRPSTAPQRVPLPSPPASSLPDGPDPESDSLRAASPTVTRFLATAITDPLLRR